MGWPDLREICYLLGALLPPPPHTHTRGGNKEMQEGPLIFAVVFFVSCSPRPLSFVTLTLSSLRRASACYPVLARRRARWNQIIYDSKKRGILPVNRYMVFTISPPPPPPAKELVLQYRKNLKWSLCNSQGLGGRWFMKKNLKQKISWHCPFKVVCEYRIGKIKDVGGVKFYKWFTIEYPPMTFLSLSYSLLFLVLQPLNIFLLFLWCRGRQKKSFSSEGGGLGLWDRSVTVYVWH